MEVPHGSIDLTGSEALDAIRKHYELEDGIPCDEFSAWKLADPFEDTRYIRGLDDAEEIAREDVSLLVVYVVNPHGRGRIITSRNIALWIDELREEGG